MTKCFKSSLGCERIEACEFVSNSLDDISLVTLGKNISTKESKAIRNVLCDNFVVFCQDGLIHCNEKMVQVLGHKLLDVADREHKKIGGSLLVISNPGSDLIVKCSQISPYI